MDNFILSVTSAILGYFTSRIANRKIKNFSHHIVALLVVSALTALFYYGTLYIKSAIKPEHKIAGRWIEKYSDEQGKTLFAIAIFETNPETDILEFKGYGYDSFGQIAGQWITYQAHFDGVEYSYLFSGRSENQDKRGDRKGVGSIRFEDNNLRGFGYFFSVSSDNKLRNFSLYKIIDSEAIKELQQNREGFIQKLYSDPNYFKQITSVQ